MKCVAGIVVVLAFLTVPGMAQPLAEGQSKFLGCAYSNVQNTNFINYWNQVTPENGGKWGAVEYNRNVMDWNALNAAYKVAKDNGYPFKNHTMIWGNQQPTWIENLDTAQQRQEIEQWFSLTAVKFPAIDYIDVVNEPLHAPPSGAGHGNYINALGGNGTTGWDWIIRSFKMARHYFPNAKLLINEYGIVNSTSTTQQYIGIINLLKADSLIDGIGIQCHAFNTSTASADLIRSNLDLLAATGLPIYVSELDIDGPSDLVQLKEYQRIFPVFWEHPAVAGVTLWGFRYGLWRTDQGAYLVNSNGSERIAFNWLKAYVNDTLTLSQSVTVNCSDDNDTIFFDETAQMTALVLPENTTIKNVSWSTNAPSIANISASGVLTPLSTGRVTVRATTFDAGKVGNRIITIVKRLVDSISISSPSDSIVTGESLQLSATVFPSNATLTQVNWTVFPSGIGQVSTSGLLTTTGTGTINIVASAKDGSGVKDTIQIVVNLQTAVNPILTDELDIYPNPSTGDFTVSGIENCKTIRVLDLYSRIISEYYPAGQKLLRINLNHIPGTYILQLSFSNTMVNRQIVIR